MRWIALIATLLSLFVLTACSRQPEPPAFPVEVLATPVPQVDLPTINEILEGDEFRFFNSLLRSTGTDAEIAEAVGLTVLAPTNAAFAQVGWTPSETDPELLRQIMRHHLLPGELSTGDLLMAGLVRSVEGGFISFSNRGNIVTADFATMTQSDVRAANGIVHVIDAFLIPPERDEIVSIWGQLRNDSRLSMMRDIVEEAGMVYMLRFGYVDGLLAPRDLAFRDLTADDQAWLSEPEHRLDLLNYLILNEPGWPIGQPILLADLSEMSEVGSQLNFRFGSNPWEHIRVTRSASDVFVDGSAILEGDRLATNGVVHLIDAVILPRLTP